MDATIFIYYFLSLSMFSQHYSVTSYKARKKTSIAEDQELAEYHFLHPEEKAKAPKTCYRKDLRNMTDICNIDPAIYFDMCKEIVKIESLRTLYTMFILDTDQIPEPCKNCSVKFYRSKLKEEQRVFVQARSCPTLIGGHPLWASKGHEPGSIFVYYENFISDEKLRMEDYIVFLDTEKPKSSDEDYS